MGRAVHEDRRPRDRHRRHDVASGGARRASSASRRSSGRRSRRSGSRPATGSGSTARRASSRSSSEPAPATRRPPPPTHRPLAIGSERVEPARILPRSVLADQVKERLLEGILTGRYRAGLADRRDAGRARAGHEPGAGPRGAPRPRGARRRRDHAVPRCPRPPADPPRAARGVRRPVGARGARRAAGGPALSDDGRSTSSPAYVDDDAGRRRATDDGARGRRGRRAVPRPDRRAGRQRHARPRVAARSSRSPGPTSRSSCPARTRSGRPTSTPRSSRRSARRDVDAVVAALERHFDEVSANMADRCRTTTTGRHR